MHNKDLTVLIGLSVVLTVALNGIGDGHAETRGSSTDQHSSLVTLSPSAVIALTGGIAGTVTDTGGSPPLEGAVVEAIQNLVVIGQDTTDALGSYGIEPLDPGIYDVVASKQGYFPDTARNVVVGEEVVVVNFELYPTATQGCVFGDVKDEESIPLPTALVKALLNSTIAGEDMTDAEGHYRIAPLADGVYDVVASKQGYLPDTVFDILVSGACVRVDFELQGVSGACGDCNGDGRVTTADATYLVAFIYRDGSPPLAESDVNLDGRTSIADATYLVAYVYRSGPPPCEPGGTVHDVGASEPPER